MSELFKTLKDAQLGARKARDTEKLTTLITLIGEIESAAKNDGNREVTDKDVTKKLTVFLKNAEEVGNLLAKREGGGYSPEAISENQREQELYKSFMPAPVAQYNDETLNRIIRQIIASRIAGAGEKPKMGVVLADLKLLHEGKYDPKNAAGIVKAELTNTAEPTK